MLNFMALYLAQSWKRHHLIWETNLQTLGPMFECNQKEKKKKNYCIEKMHTTNTIC